MGLNIVFLFRREIILRIDLQKWSRGPHRNRESWPESRVGSHEILLQTLEKSSFVSIFHRSRNAIQLQMLNNF